MSTFDVPQVTFNNRIEFPVLGLGTWKSQSDEVTQAVKDAIDIGYRLIDSAPVYGNEVEVGQGIKDKIEEGVVLREEIFITSKLWNTCHKPDSVNPALKKTLSNLGLEYLDLYLIHWPMGYKEGDELFPTFEGKTLYSNVDYVDTWREMEYCVIQGLVKSIGVSNFNSEQLERLLSLAHIKPVTNQVECHPYLNQSDLLNFCKSKGVVVTSYSPLGSPDSPWTKPEDPILLEDYQLKTLSRKHTKTPAQVLLRYQVQRGNIVIPKSVTKRRIKENFQIFDFNLSEDDMSYIDNLDCNGRICQLEWVKDHPHYPFNSPF